MTFMNDFFAGLGKSARTGLFIGAAVVLVGMAAAIWWLVSPSYQLLFGDMREADAAEVTKSLTEWKVPYRFVAGGSGIEVPSDQVYDVRMKLVSAGVPSGGHVGFELFNDADFGVTEFAQRVNYQRAIQGELERSIAALPGVENVRVHLTIRRPGLFVGQNDSSKASVALGMTPGEVLTPQQVAGIRNLVASAVDGLSPQSVVVLGPGGVLQGGAGGKDAQAGVLGQNEEQSAYENRVRERISDLLGQVFKLQTFRVSVDARLNFDEVHKVSERLIAQGESGNGLVLRKRTSSSGGAPAAQGEGEVKTGGGTQNDELDYAHGTEREEISRAPGQVERLSIAVLVPPTLTASEMERLRRLVVAAAGLDTERGDRLEIGAIDDGAPSTTGLAHAPLPGALPISERGVAGVRPKEDAASPSSTWLIGMGVLGLLIGAVLMLFFRPTARRLSDEEREAMLAKLRTWLAEGGVVS